MSARIPSPSRGGGERSSHPPVAMDFFHKMTLGLLARRPSIDSHQTPTGLTPSSSHATLSQIGSPAPLRPASSVNTRRTPTITSMIASASTPGFLANNGSATTLPQTAVPTAAQLEALHYRTSQTPLRMSIEGDWATLPPAVPAMPSGRGTSRTPTLKRSNSLIGKFSIGKLARRNKAKSTSGASGATPNRPRSPYSSSHHRHSLLPSTPRTLGSFTPRLRLKTVKRARSNPSIAKALQAQSQRESVPPLPSASTKLAAQMAKPPTTADKPTSNSPDHTPLDVSFGPSFGPLLAAASFRRSPDTTIHDASALGASALTPPKPKANTKSLPPPRTMTNATDSTTSLLGIHKNKVPTEVCLDLGYTPSPQSDRVKSRAQTPSLHHRRHRSADMASSTTGSRNWAWDFEGSASEADTEDIPPVPRVPRSHPFNINKLSDDPRTASSTSNYNIDYLDELLAHENASLRGMDRDDCLSIGNSIEELEDADASSLALDPVSSNKAFAEYDTDMSPGGHMSVDALNSPEDALEDVESEFEPLLYDGLPSPTRNAWSAFDVNVEINPPRLSGIRRADSTDTLDDNESAAASNHSQEDLAHEADEAKEPKRSHDRDSDVSGYYQNIVFADDYDKDNVGYGVPHIDGSSRAQSPCLPSLEMGIPLDPVLDSSTPESPVNPLTPTIVDEDHQARWQAFGRMDLDNFEDDDFIPVDEPMGMEELFTESFSTLGSNQSMASITSEESFGCPYPISPGGGHILPTIKEASRESSTCHGVTGSANNSLAPSTPQHAGSVDHSHRSTTTPQHTPDMPVTQVWASHSTPASHQIASTLSAETPSIMVSPPPFASPTLFTESTSDSPTTTSTKHRVTQSLDTSNTTQVYSSGHLRTHSAPADGSPDKRLDERSQSPLLTAELSAAYAKIDNLVVAKRDADHSARVRQYELDDLMLLLKDRDSRVHYLNDKVIQLQDALHHGELPEQVRLSIEGEYKARLNELEMAAGHMVMTAQAKAADATEAFKQLNGTLMEKDVGLQERDDEILRLRREVNKGDKTISLLRDKVSRATFELDELRCKVQTEAAPAQVILDLQSELGVQKRKTAELEAKLREASKTKDDMFTLADKYKQLLNSERENNAENKERWGNWGRDRAKLDEEVARLTAQVWSASGNQSKLETALYRCQQVEIPRLKEDLETFKNLLEAATQEDEADLSIQSIESTHTLISQQEQINHLGRALDDKTEEVRDVEKQFERHTRDCTAELCRLREDLKTLTATNNEIKVDHRQAVVEQERHRERAADNYSRCQTYLAEIDSLNITRAKLSAENDDLRRAVASNHLELQKLNTKVANMSSNRDLLNSALESKQLELELLRRGPATPRRPPTPGKRQTPGHARSPSEPTNLPSRLSPMLVNKRVRPKRMTPPPLTRSQAMESPTPFKAKSPLSPTAATSSKWPATPTAKVSSARIPRPTPHKAKSKPTLPKVVIDTPTLPHSASVGGSKALTPSSKHNEDSWGSASATAVSSRSRSNSNTKLSPAPSRNSSFMNVPSAAHSPRSPTTTLGSSAGSSMSAGSKSHIPVRKSGGPGVRTPKSQSRNGGGGGSTAASAPASVRGVPIGSELEAGTGVDAVVETVTIPVLPQLTTGDTFP